MMEDMNLKARGQSLKTLMDTMDEDEIKRVPKVTISISTGSADELMKGLKHEMEHKDTIEEIKENPEMPDEEGAKLIAKDHIEEDPKYYDKLEDMGEGESEEQESGDPFEQLLKRKKKEKEEMGM